MLKKITKQDKKMYNHYVDQHNENITVANAVAPFLIIGALIGGCWMWQYSPFIAKGIFIFGLVVLVGRLLSGVRVNDPHNHTDHTDNSNH